MTLINEHMDLESKLQVIWDLLKQISRSDQLTKVELRTYSKIKNIYLFHEIFCMNTLARLVLLSHLTHYISGNYAILTMLCTPTALWFYILFPRVKAFIMDEGLALPANQSSVSCLNPFVTINASNSLLHVDTMCCHISRKQNKPEPRSSDEGNYFPKPH